MARHPRSRDCSNDGCTRARHKGDLCAKHYAMVPQAMRMKLALDCMTASHEIARQGHAAQLDHVRNLLATEAVAA